MKTRIKVVEFFEFFFNILHFPLSSNPLLNILTLTSEVSLKIVDNLRENPRKLCLF